MRSERCFLISAVVSALPFCARWFVQKHIMCLSVSSFLICLSVMRLHWWHSVDSTMPHFLRKICHALIGKDANDLFVNQSRKSFSKNLESFKSENWAAFSHFLVIVSLFWWAQLQVLMSRYNYRCVNSVIIILVGAFLEQDLRIIFHSTTLLFWVQNMRDRTWKCIWWIAALLQILNYFFSVLVLMKIESLLGFC